MKPTRLAAAFPLLLASTTLQAEDIWHDSVYGCAIGGGVAGTSSAFAIASLASGAGTIPTTAVIVGNTVFGCGLGTIGVMLYHGVSSLYTGLFGDSPQGR